MPVNDDPNPAVSDLGEGATSERRTMVYPPAEPAEQDPGVETAPLGPGSDPEADAEWVVQTTRGIRLGLPVAGLLALLLVAAGFWGGAAVEKSHGGSSAGASLASLASRFRAARAGSTSTTSGTGTTSGLGTGGGGFGGGGFGGGGFGSSAAATGTISVVAGNTLYVLTSTGSLVKVTLAPSTTMTRDADATAVDLRPGDTVVVQGSTSPNGNVSATSISATAPGVSSTAGRFGLGGGAGAAGGGAGTSTTAGG